MRCPYCGEKLELVRYRFDVHKIVCRKCGKWWEEEFHGSLGNFKLNSQELHKKYFLDNHYKKTREKLGDS